MGSIINPLKTRKPKPLKTKSLINPRKTYKVYNKKKGLKALFLFSYVFIFLLFSFCFLIFLFL